MLAHAIPCLFALSGAFALGVIITETRRALPTIRRLRRLRDAMRNREI